MFYSLNSIFFQREVYPATDFQAVTKHGLTVWMAQDQELRKYLDTVLEQMKTWIEDGNLKEVVLVIQSVESDETLERWSFTIEGDTEMKTAQKGEEVEVDLKEIQKGIKDVVRQIVATITFLPSIEDNIKFDLLFYTKDDVEVENWDPNTAHIIQGDSDSVKLRSWSSKIHKINTAVTYKK